MTTFSELCGNAGLTRDEICEALGVAHGVLEDYELGRRKPSAREVQILCGFSILTLDRRHGAANIADKTIGKRRGDTLPLPVITRALAANGRPMLPRPRSSKFRLSGSLSLPFADRREIGLPEAAARCALEDEDFPFEALSDVCEAESWRKEINRPLAHIHKWWAQRLGTVFRAMVIGAMAPPGADILALYYSHTRVRRDAIVFDPFMGSGTTLCEATKLGARAIGRDINPVAHFLVKNALSDHDRPAILRMFRDIERDVSGEIRRYYLAKLDDGTIADVLYYFWVKQAECPSCSQAVDLFASYVFAQHAYPTRHPEAHAVCPGCGNINRTEFDSRTAICNSCGMRFDPQDGPAKGKAARCSHCGEGFAIVEAIRAKQRPPSNRLYAKLVLTVVGEKIYLRATDEDRALYETTKHELKLRKNAFPIVSIEPGYNTNQALGYNYRFWHEMFNARQLLCISILVDRVRRIEDRALRELFACLLSGALEFNNMFASYKGEGTGAVRHMFAHHILKPERVPLEANLWGTPKSSGSFSTMFESRIIRALDYADNPFEQRVVEQDGKKSAAKVYGLSNRIGYDIAATFPEFESGKRVYLSCGTSAETDIPDSSIDAVLSDPPFFDNVHYSQLADFFHVWQQHILGENGGCERFTTRSESEVQSADATTFTKRLEGVFREVHRVLKANGVFAFTYHHSRAEGWSSVLYALIESGFVISAAHPIKSEMSVAMPKLQAKQPIDLDIILVCRKRVEPLGGSWNRGIWTNAAAVAGRQIRRLGVAGRRLSRNDVRVVVMSQLLRGISSFPSADEASIVLDALESEIEALIDRLATSDEAVRSAEWKAG